MLGSSEPPKLSRALKTEIAQYRTELCRTSTIYQEPPVALKTTQTYRSHYLVELPLLNSRSIHPPAPRVCYRVLLPTARGEQTLAELRRNSRNLFDYNTLTLTPVRTTWDISRTEHVQTRRVGVLKKTQPFVVEAGPSREECRTHPEGVLEVLLHTASVFSNSPPHTTVQESSLS